jgi:hypothetical protein
MLSPNFTSWWANKHGVLHHGDGQIMLRNKFWWYEGIRCSRIKYNHCRVWVCREYTQYHILGLLGFLGSHVINLAIGEILQPFRTLLLTGSLVWLLGSTVLGHVASQYTFETHTKSLTSLRSGILLVWGCQMRNLLHILPGLLHNWMSCLLLGMGHWKSRMLCLRDGMLHWELGTLILKLWARDLHQCTTHKRGPDKLTGLWKAGPSVACNTHFLQIIKFYQISSALGCISK